MGTKRDRRRAKVKDEILTAALELILEGGEPALSMRAIAKNIDYSAAGIYEYFSNKADIIAELRLQGFATFSAAFEGLDETLTPLEQLRHSSHAYVEFAQENRAYYLLLFGNRIPSSGALDAVQASPMFVRLVHIIEEGMTSNAIRDDKSALELAYSWWAFLHGLAMLDLLLVNMQPDEKLDGHAIDLMLKGMTP